MNLTVYADGFLTAGDATYRAVYGKNGIGPKGREGDGISPEGAWPLRQVYYRPDRLEKPDTALPIEALTPAMAWCDVPGDPCYNRLVTLPYPCSDEKLWRDDRLYDVVIVLGYNDDPIIDGMGSAIFFHIVRPAYTPSTGCASVSLGDMLEILPRLGPASTLTFTGKSLKGGPALWPYTPT